jgi:GxxExxY protein
MNTNRHELKMAETILLKDEVYQITGCAMMVLNTLGHGFSEKVYENALAVEMADQKIPFKQQIDFNVTYKNISVGTYIPDFIVNDEIIVELKTVDRISDVEKGQVLNYLKVTGLKVGLILNFKNAKLEWQRMVL